MSATGCIGRFALCIPITHSLSRLSFASSLKVGTTRKSLIVADIAGKSLGASDGRPFLFLEEGKWCRCHCEAECGKHGEAAST